MPAVSRIVGQNGMRRKRERGRGHERPLSQEQIHEMGRDQQPGGQCCEEIRRFSMKSRIGRDYSRSDCNSNVEASALIRADLRTGHIPSTRGSGSMMRLQPPPKKPTRSQGLIGNAARSHGTLSDTRESASHKRTTLRN